jgi:recombinational DNA repair ATPase RecF
MGIDKVIIKEHEILNDQVWVPNEGLNIITSKNGGGKTSLLRYINEKYKESHNIRHIFDHTSSFPTLTDVALYRNEHNYNQLDINYQSSLRHASSYQNFVPVQKAMYEIRNTTNDSAIIDCNKFFEKSSLHIRIADWSKNYGRTLFISNGKEVEFKNISNGEKTAFILWLITRENPKPNVLLLDELDSSMNDDVLGDFYGHLQNLSKEYQIFITTNRWRYHTGLTDNKQFTFFTIKDGTVTVGKPHYLLNK